MSKRQNTNLSDASQSSTASYLNADSMAAQPPTDPPRSPRPMTRSQAQDVRNNPPRATTNNDPLRVVDNRQGHDELAGMLFAEEADASSSASSPAPSPGNTVQTSCPQPADAATTAQDSGASPRALSAEDTPANHQSQPARSTPTAHQPEAFSPRASRAKRPASEIEEFPGPCAIKEAHRKKQAKFKNDFNALDRLNRRHSSNGEASGSNTAVENDETPGDERQDTAATNQDLAQADEAGGSEEQHLVTVSGTLGENSLSSKRSSPRKKT